ncbi:MAG: hypothetical protein GKS06_08835 [Acidobacteria bacterium]|nr:hypothetical protein [Acidobacteriota bacterium]
MTRSQDQVIDAILVLRCQSGDSGAFETLAGRWQRRLLAHAARLLGDATAATDAVQDSWVAIARGLRRLDDPNRFAGRIGLCATSARTVSDALSAIAGATFRSTAHLRRLRPKAAPTTQIPVIAQASLPSCERPFVRCRLSNELC